ncbi:hypothetical protein A0H81_09796 [Grifola frondosa]|uniref:Transmembrane protein 135 N-terminal domain-containing protein n=1 Tax=Grifola frondosa TaxID=5627 RepID=A0A1C7LZF4_GRIFR|nr:hypothetical protein A0H81_09796 [Grifola frondosa]
MSSERDGRQESLPYTNRTPSFIQFAPKRAMASFENLVVLANYEERLREAKKAVWRDRGEKPAELEDLWECLEHASRGGLRMVGDFGIRNSVGCQLNLAHDEDQEGTKTPMLGSFVAIYKFILNALPILLPEPVPKTITHARSRSLFRASLPLDNTERTAPGIPERGRTPHHVRARLSISAQAHQVWVRKRTRRWYSVLAGALAGGIAITFETRNRRVGIAQQMFVRGLQGSFNALSNKHGFRIPHGDVIVFSLCCGQILYGFLLRPDTLPRSYLKWIQTASKVSPEGVSINRDLVRDGVFKFSEMESVLRRKDTTSAHCAELIERLTMFRWMLPIYGALHFVPMLLFRRSRVAREPLRMLLRAALGTARSSAFLGVFVIIYQSFFCAKHQLYDHLTALRSPAAHSVFSSIAKRLPQRLIDVIISKPSFWLGGLLSGLSLFVEEKRRREELAMYVLPKGLESAWVMARGKGWVFRTGEFGEILLTAMGMGMVMSTYQNDPQHLSGLVRRILYQFVGPN